MATQKLCNRVKYIPPHPNWLASSPHLDALAHSAAACLAAVDEDVAELTGQQAAKEAPQLKATHT
jgi:hypothetical protein